VELAACATGRATAPRCGSMTYVACFTLSRLQPLSQYQFPPRSPASGKVIEGPPITFAHTLQVQTVESSAIN
jgi:hypothetical protein